MFPKSTATQTPTRTPTQRRASASATPSGSNGKRGTRNGRARGAHPVVPPSERIKRRELLSAMLAAGASREEMDHTMAVEFGMTALAVGSLLNKVVQSWADEEAERRPTWKRAAMKRMHGHIAAARVAKNWNAVAALERLLAQMQGTMEPIEVNVNVEATVRESVLNVIAMASPERIQQLAATALRLRAAQEEDGVVVMAAE